MTGGFIFTYRSIQSHWLWQEKPFSPGQAWLDLVMLAAFKDHELKCGRILRRGELWATYRILGERWGWGKDCVARFIRKLESCGMVNVKRDRRRDTGGTLIFIVNFDRYQCPQRDTECDTNETQTRHKRDNQKKGNNEKTGTDVNGRSHSTHQVSTHTPETGVPAGAPPPLLEKQPGENDNGEDPRPAPQEKTPDVKIPLQDDTKQATTTQASTSTPPAVDHATVTNPVNAKVNAKANQGAAQAQATTVPQGDRPADVQGSISLLGELLRRGGWDEVSVRRFLKWLIRDSRGPGCTLPRGVWVHRACEGDYWQLAAHALGVKAASKPPRDEVSLLISLIDKGYQPREEHYRTAKAKWLCMDDDPERAEPIYMREVCAEIGKHIPPPQPQRSTAEVKRRLLSFDGAAGV